MTSLIIRVLYSTPVIVRQQSQRGMRHKMHLSKKNTAHDTCVENSSKYLFFQTRYRNIALADKEIRTILVSITTRSNRISILDNCSKRDDTAETFTIKIISPGVQQRRLPLEDCWETTVSEM